MHVRNEITDISNNILIRRSECLDCAATSEDDGKRNCLHLKTDR